MFLAESLSQLDGNERTDPFEDQVINPMASRVEQLQRKYKSEEIVYEDLGLLDMLGAHGWCDRETGFIVTKETQNAHPLVSAMGKYLQNPKSSLRTAEHVLAKFLVEISKVSSPSFYGYVSIIIQALYDCLQLYGEHFLVKLEQQNKAIGKVLGETKGSSSFCENESADYICIIFDFFLRVFVPNYLQTSDFEFNFVLRLLRALNVWMVKYNLSKVEVNFNSY